MKLESLSEVLDLFLPSQEDENPTWRQVSVNLDHFFERGLLVVLLRLLRIDGRDWELARLHIDAVGWVADRLREEPLVFSKIFDSERG